MRAPAWIVTATLLAIAAPAAAQDQVDADIALVKKQPADMDRVKWKEKRRDAARALGNAGDKRAVPVLIEVVETESFDAIAEIAIEALGKLGDDRAVPVLRKVVGDKSRDRFVREVAEKALAKLGATPGDDGGGGSDDDDGGDDDDDDDDDVLDTGGGGGRPVTGLGDAILGLPDRSLPTPPSFAADVLAATERLTLAAGGAHLEYDSIRRRPSFSGNGSAGYERSLDRVGRAYRYGAAAELAAGVIDFPDDGNQSRSTEAHLGGDAEMRFYSGQIYGAGLAALNVNLGYLRISRPDADDTKELRLDLDTSLGLAAGWGRVVDAGERLRLKKIERVLERNRMLGRPITDDLADKIAARWWSLRRETGFHQRLVATIAMLREAGVLLGEPDASMTYQLLEVLRDGQLSHRPRGLDIMVGIGESYVVRDDALLDDNVPPDDGRLETAFARARYGQQRDDGKVEIVGDAFARIRILAADEPAPWAVGATAAFRRYAYGDYMDPIGAFELTASVGASDDDLDQTDLGTRLGGSVGWLWLPNRASRFRVAAEAQLDAGELILGATFEAQYGWLDASY